MTDTSWVAIDKINDPMFDPQKLDSRISEDFTRNLVEVAYLNDGFKKAFQYSGSVSVHDARIISERPGFLHIKSRQASPRTPVGTAWKPAMERLLIPTPLGHGVARLGHIQGQDDECSDGGHDQTGGVKAGVRRVGAEEQRREEPAYQRAGKSDTRSSSASPSAVGREAAPRRQTRHQTDDQPPDESEHWCLRLSLNEKEPAAFTCCCRNRRRGQSGSRRRSRPAAPARGGGGSGW